MFIVYNHALFPLIHQEYFLVKILRRGSWELFYNTVVRGIGGREIPACTYIEVQIILKNLKVEKDPEIELITKRPLKELAIECFKHITNIKPPFFTKSLWQWWCKSCVLKVSYCSKQEIRFQCIALNGTTKAKAFQTDN